MMLPFGHAAVGYGLYSLVMRRRVGRSPNGTEAAVALFGSQFPDLVDKPLMWLFGEIFMTGRMISHSLLIAALIILLVGVLGYITATTNLALAFGIGYLSHPFVDAFQFVLQGSVAVDIVEISFLVWPLQPPVEQIVRILHELPFVGTLLERKEVWTARYLPSGYVLYIWMRVLELVLLILAAIRWRADGYPGLRGLLDVAPVRQTD